MRAFARSSSIPPIIDNVNKVQAGYKAQPLSAYLKQPPPPAAPTIAFPKINKDLAKKNFFEYLDFALQFAPPAPNETEIRAQASQHWRRPGQDIQFQGASAKAEAGNRHRYEDRARAKSMPPSPMPARVVNGWIISGMPGDSAHYNSDWLGRAAAAQAGIYGNSPEEAMYPFTRKDGTGKALDGSKSNYTITFPAGPASAGKRLLVGHDV